MTNYLFLIYCETGWRSYSIKAIQIDAINPILAEWFDQLNPSSPQGASLETCLRKSY